MPARPNVLSRSVYARVSALEAIDRQKARLYRSHSPPSRSTPKRRPVCEAAEPLGRSAGRTWRESRCVACIGGGSGSGFPAGSLIHVGPWLRSSHVASFERSNLETRSTDQFVGVPIEMATPLSRDQHGVSRRCLASHPWLGRKPMLDKEHLSAGLQHPSHLRQCSGGISHGAQGPRHHNGIEDRIGERKLLARCSHE
jgi:hypothetical protein